MLLGSEIKQAVVLLTSKMDYNSKKEIIENEFEIPLEDDLETEVNCMCNLS